MVLGISGDSTSDVVTYEIGVPGKLIGSDFGTMRTTGAGIGLSGGLGTNRFCAVYDMSYATMVDWVTEGTMGMRTSLVTASAVLHTWLVTTLVTV